METSVGVFMNEKFRVFMSSSRSASGAWPVCRNSLTRGRRGRTVGLDTATQYAAN